MSTHDENKRLYAIDVALVGEDKAPKRWHRQFGSRKPWILCTPNGPNWDDNFQFRRAPYAPALPSWDWREAPKTANYRYRHGRPPSSWWGGYPVGAITSDFEPRPPQAWFDVTANMTRNEYEALQRLSRGESIEPASGETADDGVLSGADEYRGSHALAFLASCMLDEVDSAGWWQGIQYYAEGGWVYPDSEFELAGNAAFGRPIRRKPANPKLTIDALAQEIRRVDGNHSLGAGALAEALMPYLVAASGGQS